MVAEDVVNKLLEYLKKQGQTNTFRLASELSIDRHRILNIVKKLEEKQAVEVRSGVVRFLKFPKEEKKVVTKKTIEIKKVPSNQKKRVLEDIQAENKRLKERVSELQKAPPKIIRRTKVTKIIQKIPVKSKKLEEQAERIKELEETVKELQSVPPKIIDKIKKVPVKVREEIPLEEEVKPKKFKIPKFFIGLKNIQQIKKPEFIEQKIRAKKLKINFEELNKNIQQLHVPEILRI